MTKFNSDVILYGGPGSGKGTQAQLLIKKLSAHHLDMGAAIRQLARGRSELAREVRGIMESGKLIPTAVTKLIASDHLRHAGSRPVIFDGYPRSPKQAHDLDALLRSVGRQVLMVYLKLPLAVIRARLLKRAKQEGRIDDQNPKVISRRIKIFQEQSKKILSYYRSTRRLKLVNGDQSVAAVQREINRALGL